MAIYTVHSKGDPATDAVLVPEGFSWPAFLLTGLWALWHRMWIVAIIAISVWLLVTGLGPRFGLVEPYNSLITFVLSLWFGLEAQNLRRWSLKRRGFRDIGITAGEDAEEAELRFFSDYVEERPANSAVPVPVFRPQVAEHEPLGLFTPQGRAP